MIAVGDFIETRKSHIPARVIEIGATNPDGSVRLLVDTGAGERWTTY